MICIAITDTNPITETGSKTGAHRGAFFIQAKGFLFLKKKNRTGGVCYLPYFAFAKAYGCGDLESEAGCSRRASSFVLALLDTFMAT